MSRDPHSGVLVFGPDATVQHVDPAAADLLDTDREALVSGTAAPLQASVSAPDGATYESLRAFVARVFAEEGSSASVVMDGGPRATARVTYGPEAPRAVVVTVRPAPNRPPASTAGTASPNQRSQRPNTEQLRSRQGQLLDRIARGVPLSEVLADLVAFVEEERPGLRASVLLLDPETNTLRHGAAPTLPDAYVEAIDGEEIGAAVGSCGTAAYLDAPVIAEDIARDDRWAEYRDVALDHGLRACWSTPIHGEDEAVLGTFALYYDEPRVPDERDRVLIDEASRLAGIAIEHDRQKQELQLQRDQLRRLVENAQPIIFFLDEDGTFRLSEGEDLAAVGLSPGEVVGESIYDLYADHPTVLDYVDRALDGESIDAVIEVDGVTFDIWYAPYYDRSGEVAGCIGMAVDITERREAEAALRDSRDLLRRTQALANVGGWIYDSETGVMAGTDETYRIYGLPLDAELTLEQSLSFYPPEIAATLQASAERCLEHGEPFDEEGPMVSAEGTRRWVRIRGEPRRNEEGTIVKMVGTVQDLTERHAIEERLREQKEWLRSITENASGGIYRSTDDGLVYANQALLDLFGYESLEEMTAADPTSFYADPERRDELLQRESEEGGVDAVEVEYRRKDGSTFTGLLRSTKVDRGDDEPAYYDGVVTDITEQKARERTLRAHREKMNALYEITERLFTAESAAAVAAHVQRLLDEAFDYPLVGVSFVDGRTIVPERVSRGEGDWELPAVQSMDVEGESLAARALRAGEPEVAEDLQETSNDIAYGDLRSAVCVPIAEKGTIFLGRVTPGRPDAFDLHLVDILAKKAAAVLERIEHERELKAAKREAEEASRLKSALLANMSHEIRTPLTSIIGFAGILRNNLSNHNARYADLVHRGGKRLMNTLDSVLQLSKLEAGVIEPASEPADLVANVRKTVNLHRSEAKAAEVGLQFDAGADVLPVEWDPTVTQRVLSNLLSNAIKFTPEGGTVTVRVEEEDDRVALVVADTGIGIGDAFRDRLFDAFTQESEGMQREHEGSGLGLAIVKRLVDLMEGRIDVDSTKGEGTTFRVVLPRRGPEP
jgi:PAS domain S-box-containing protein